MKRIQELIPHAIEAIDYLKIENEKDPGVYNGYVASFGAGIIHSGLLPVIAMYSNAEKSTRDGDKSKIPAAIFHVIQKINKDIKDKYLFDYILNQLREDPSQYQKLNRLVMDASIAVKLALRTYKLK